VAETDLLRLIPQVDAVLREPAVGLVVERWGPALARRLVHEELERERARARSGEAPADAPTVADRVARRAGDLERRRLRRVVNATGVVLHTNLGRAPLAPDAIAAAAEAAGAVALELDLATGRRGERAPVAATLAAALTDAEAALVVNNNAGAVLLALAALARGREVIVSRGELIEIGGEFRLPEIMEASGAILREVGTTNRTHLRDYRRAIGERTGCVLVVHPSNYRVVGYTATPLLEEVAAVAHEAGVPLLHDIGSGLLAPDPALPGEPDARSSLGAGADLVSFSGDKLLGGPQAGILVGRRRLVEACRRHPVARAVRADKLTLAAMEATLHAHARGEATRLPVRAMLAADPDLLRARAERLVAALPPGAAAVSPGESVVGGGSLPGRVLPTVVVSLVHPRPQALAAALREADPPVVARVERGRVVLDLRTVSPAEDDALAAACRAALEGAG
jgi:L-seryl-tRNA(Ser) seleniumtransferase